MHLTSSMALMRDSALDQGLRPLGLSTSRYRVLGVLVRFGRTRMTDLANLTAMDRTSLTRIADQMVQAGLVARTSTPKDRRQVFLEITETGREAHRDAVAVVLGYNARLLRGIPEPVQREAARTLMTMAANLAPNPGARDGIIHYADPANDRE
ncbi:MarR family winged helix-turn-helix transcriptional regulator [Caulobacter sp. KR2-114]|uniref:MarR family winged helix-turn-helix transcriptional regulator n=1 Tax=Caulobacter sp. KR2-114 TaxID=3400912 RepID=UPI003C0F6D86